MKRYWIVEMEAAENRRRYPTVTHDFTADNVSAAIIAFRTLYGEQPDYVLFEQVACTDPRSHTESDDTSGETGVL